MKRKILITVLAIVSVLIFSSIYLFICTKAVSSEQNSYTQRIEVPSGTTIKGIAKTLKKEKLIRNKTVFYFGKYKY